MDRRDVALLVVSLAVATAGCPVGLPADGPTQPSVASPVDAGTDGGMGGATPGVTDAPDGTTVTSTATPVEPFAVSIANVSECGQTCRDVTASLTFQRDRTAENVTVELRMYAGNGTGGRLLWNETRALGDLAGGESATVTRRVRLSPSEALAVDGQDGWVTIRAVVRSATENRTVTHRRRVG